MPAFIPPERIIEDLKRVSSNLGRSPRTVEYDQLGKFNVITVRKRFGSWDEALTAAGLDLLPSAKQKFTDDDISDEIARITDMLGHAPSYTEMKAHGAMSPDTLARRTGVTGFSTGKVEIADWDLDKIDPADGNCVAGIVTGEGSFSVVSSGHIGFSVGLRADDREVLEYIRTTMGLPNEVRVFSNKRRRELGQRVGDEARLFASNKSILSKRVVPFFDRFKLRGRKALDFEIFKEAVLLMVKHDENGLWHKWLRPNEKVRLEELVAQLKNLRFDPSKAIVT